MKDFVLGMIERMPFDLIVDQLEEAVRVYKRTKNIETKKNLGTIAGMIGAKCIMDETGKSANELAQDMEKAEKGKKFFEPGTN